jgi:gas vesicle protein GvpA/GvpJ/GvpM family
MSPSRSNRPSPPKPPQARTRADAILGPEDASLLDIVDNLLNKGVVLNGDLTIGLARVDLIYARLSLLLSAADRVLPGEQAEFMERHHARHRLKRARRRARS